MTGRERLREPPKGGDLAADADGALMRSCWDGERSVLARSEHFNRASRWKLSM